MSKPTGQEIPGLDEALSHDEDDVKITSEEGDDLPVTPPESMPRATERQMAGMPDDGETIEQRIAQEEPDPHSAYGAPLDEGGLDGRETLAQDDRDLPAEEAALRVQDGPEG